MISDSPRPDPATTLPLRSDPQKTNEIAIERRASQINSQEARRDHKTIYSAQLSYKSKCTIETAILYHRFLFFYINIIININFLCKSTISLTASGVMFFSFFFSRTDLFYDESKMYFVISATSQIPKPPVRNVDLKNFFCPTRKIRKFMEHNRSVSRSAFATPMYGFLLAFFYVVYRLQSIMPYACADTA